MGVITAPAHESSSGSADATALIADRPAVGAPAETIERILDATLDCVARFGVAKTSLDDVARVAGVSRATVYRASPGGKDRLIGQVVDRELARFLDTLRGDLERCDDAESLIVTGIATTLGFLGTHEALRTVLLLEPGLVLPQFAFHRLDAVLDLAAAFATPYLRPYVTDDDTARGLAEHLTRIVLSYGLQPGDGLDATDDATIRAFARHYILPGMVADRPAATT